MRVNDLSMSRGGLTAIKQAHVPLTITQSKTKRPMHIARPGQAFQVTAAQIAAVAYTADIDVDIVLAARLNAIASSPTLAIDTTPEDFKLAAFVARVNGKWVEKGAATGISFTAAHVVTALKHGIILVQMDNAGTVTTKVPAATPTTAMAYNSSALALAAKPAPDSGKIELGYILIEAGAADWDGNTDDMTDASDLTTAVFASAAVDVVSVLSAAFSPVAMELSSATVLTTAAAIDRTGQKDIVALVTTDGTAAITNGTLEVHYRGIGSKMS